MALTAFEPLLSRPRFESEQPAYAFLCLVNRKAARTKNTMAESFPAFLRSLDLRSNGFEISPEITLKAHFSGARIGQVPGRQTTRTRGTSSFRFVRVATGYARVLLGGLGMRLGLAGRGAKP